MTMIRRVFVRWLTFGAIVGLVSTVASSTMAFWVLLLTVAAATAHSTVLIMFAWPR